MQVDGAAKAYMEEAIELLNDLEESLLELQQDPQSSEHIGKAFRAMHTIKGSGAMFGFEEIARFTHELETIFDKVRSEEIQLSEQLINVALHSKDHIEALLQMGLEPSPDLISASDELIDSLNSIVPKTETPDDEEAPQPSAEESEQGTPETFWVHFAPSPTIMQTGTKPLGLLEELSELGNMCCSFNTDDIPLLQDFSPDTTYGVWDIVLNTDKGLPLVKDVFIFVEDDCEIDAEQIGEGNVRASDIQDLLGVACSNFDFKPQRVATILRDTYQQKLSSRRAAPKKQAGPPAKAVTGPSSIRVDSDRLDKLVNMVGEMVILQSRLSQAVHAEHDHAVMSQIAEDLERLTDEMRENALGLRMLPIGTMYNAFKRLVHDLSGSLGKEIELITEGAETELDKTVIDRLKDPLVHILRNSLDHGIEAPAEREQAGKTPKGTIRVAASHSAGDVLITITDDGKGIDPDKIRAKAVEKGLISPEAELDRNAIFNLIFEPGFSTAQQISDVSGRGVGMDVVRQSIDSLRGQVDVISELGKGTTLSIRLPLTLAIIDGFNVLVGEESFIVPLACLRGFQERFVESYVKQIATIERMGDMVPCVSLRQIFHVPGKQPEYERIVITEVDGSIIGLAVDQVVGRQQAVIKSLDDSFRRIKWISGTTINGDGSISLIMDIPQLIRYVTQQTEVVRSN